jgi:hypothetical protein
MLSAILVTVRSRSAGSRFFIPPIRDSKFAEMPVGTLDSLSLSVRRVDMDEKR